MNKSKKTVSNKTFIDLLIVLIVTSAGMFLCSLFDAYEKFHEVTRSWEKWNFDDLTLGVFVFAGGIVWFSFRRWKEARREMEMRIRAEEERRVIEVQKRESLNIMAGSIAHNFNNLLTVVLGSLELSLSDLSPDSPGKQNIDRAEKAAREAASLSTLMLTYVGQHFIPLKTVEPGVFFQDIREFLDTFIPVDITLETELPRTLPEIRSDPEQVRQIVSNLVINSVEAIGEETGTIVLTSGITTCDRAFFESSCLNEGQAEGDYVFIEVSDSGCGMDKEMISKIFDPYFTTRFTGRGLGLAAVLGIVKAHKGTITVESKPGKGSTVRVLFPIAN